MADELPPPEVPQSPRLERARAALAGLFEARSCWEALASHGVIPMAWVDDDARGFALRTRDGESRRAPFPPLPQAALSLAADPEGVLAAEAIAREIAARFGMPRERVCWFFQPGNRAAHNVYRLPEPHPEGVREQLVELGRLGYGMGPVETAEIVLFAPLERG